MAFFNNKNNKHSIQIYDSSNNSNSIKALRIRIKKLDEQIIEINKTILEAQMVRVRSIFSAKTNFIKDFQKRFVETSVSNSISWHQRQLILIREERNKLQIHLERITGQFWPNRLKRLFLFLGLIIFLFSLSLILLLGIIAAFYFLPIILLLSLLFWIIKSIKK